MTNQPTCDNSVPLELPTDKPRRPYQPPKLMPLESEIAGGAQNLQEADGTGFVS